jgi:predicted nucleotidyltransferase
MKADNSIVLSKIKTLVKEIDRDADIILYGSRARGDEHPDSDWDILILVNSKTDLDYERIFRHRLYEIELEIGEAFSISVYNKNEWRSKYWMTPLFQNIASEGIRI